MSEIINTANVNEYTYVDPCTEDSIKKGPISDNASSEFGIVKLNFTKSCEPCFADLGDKITLNYTFSNNTMFIDLGISELKVSDKALTKTNLLKLISTKNVKSPINTIEGSFKVDIKRLPPGSSVTATLVYEVVSLPNNPYELKTEATGEFYGRFNIYVGYSSCGTIIGNGNLTIEKTVDQKIVVSGQEVKYTIRIKNIGNIASQIEIGKFIDSPPLDYLKDIKLIYSPKKIIWNGTSITNIDVLTIAPGSDITVEFTALVN